MENKTTDILEFLEVTPTGEQIVALQKIKEFSSEENKDDFIILQGSAGTGKSTIIKAITNYLTEMDTEHYLSAPTARAAKVMQSKSRVIAKTIHSLIYKPEPLKKGAGVRFNLKNNNNTEFSIYIIDESSMISDTLNNSENYISSAPLLTDLLAYVKDGNPKNKVIFIGDHYQLPPVNSYHSPALSKHYLIDNKEINGDLLELNQVMRQTQGSYVMNNAEKLRDAIKRGIQQPVLSFRMLNSSTQALNTLCEKYDRDNINKTTLIAWTNRDVNWFNNKYREVMGLSGKPLNIGENIMLNNNIMTSKGYVMNGEIVKINELDPSIERFEEIQFQNASIEFIDGEGEKVQATTKIMLDTLHTHNGELPNQKTNQLIHTRYKLNKDFRESQNPMDDIYVGALRPRYAYAITCHKAQGGEWENVILHPYRPKDDLRWLYTANTRASKEIYSYRTYN